MKYIQRMKSKGKIFYVLGVSKKQPDGSYNNLTCYISKVEYDFLEQSQLFYVKEYKDFDKEK